MGKVLGIITLYAFGFFTNPFTNQDNELYFLSRLITFIIWLLSLFFLMWRFKVNPIQEFRTIFQFNAKSKEFERSFKRIIAGTVFPIGISAMLISPIATYTLIKINSSNYHKSHLQKTKIKNIYHSGTRSKKYFVDIVYDGKPITIRISKEMEIDIDQNAQLPNLNRGQLGFYFIRD